MQIYADEYSIDNSIFHLLNSYTELEMGLAQTDSKSKSKIATNVDARLICKMTARPLHMGSACAIHLSWGMWLHRHTALQLA